MPKNTAINIEENGNKKIKIENLLNPTNALEESIEDSRTIPLDEKFIHEFLSPSNSPKPKNSDESRKSSSPSKSSISSIFPSLDFDSKSPS
jgi:hypothetical protein